jgi:hypothetical protein
LEGFPGTNTLTCLLQIFINYGRKKFYNIWPRTVEAVTGEEVLEQVSPAKDVASVTKVQSQTAATTTVQALEGTSQYSKQKAAATRATRIQVPMTIKLFASVTDVPYK